MNKPNVYYRDDRGEIYISSPAYKWGWDLAVLSILYTTAGTWLFLILHYTGAGQ